MKKIFLCFLLFFIVGCSLNYYRVKDEKMEVAVSRDGHFTFGMVRQGENLDLLFGHPNGKYSNRIGTSFTTIRCNGRDYLFSELEIRKQSFFPLKKQIQIQVKIPNTPVLITQKISSFIGKKDRFILSYIFENRSKEPIEIGLRLLLDTFAGSNDGVPFTIPGSSHQSQIVFQKEVEFTSISSPIWETYEQKGGFVFLRNIMIGNGLTPPDKVVFASWKKAHNTIWNYKIDSEVHVLGDSSVIKWWQPRMLLPDSHLEIATAFEYTIKQEGVSVDLQDSATGFGYLNLLKKNTSQQPIKVKYTIQSSDVKVFSHTGMMHFDFPIPPGATLNRTLPLNLSGSGNVTLNITENDGHQKKQFDIQLNLDKDDKGVSAPIWKSSSNYPIEYLADSKNMQLLALAKFPNSQKVFKQVEMHRGKKRGKKYVYHANIPLHKYRGELDIEIIKKNSTSPRQIERFRPLGSIAEINHNHLILNLIPGIKIKPGQNLSIVDKKQEIAIIKMKAILSYQARAILISRFRGYPLQPGMKFGIVD